MKKVNLRDAYVHGYGAAERLRLQDQASTLVELLHADTAYPAAVACLKLDAGLIDAATFDAGTRGLERTTRLDGVFCYTFFKATAIHFD